MLLGRGALFAWHERRRSPFTISEVLAWQQRLETQSEVSSVMRLEPQSDVPASDGGHADEKPAAVAARRMGLLRTVGQSVSGALWLAYLVGRRPYGTMLAIVCFAISFVGLSCFPLPESAATRLSLRVMAGHYIFACLVFGSFALALLAGHGRTGWPLLPFAVLIALVGLSALAGHLPAVAGGAAGRHLHTFTAVLEWACAVLFHLAMMLPPDRPPDHRWRLLG